MKIRQGFVSNSSNTCFIMQGVTIDRNKLFDKKMKQSTYPTYSIKEEFLHLVDEEEWPSKFGDFMLRVNTDMREVHIGNMDFMDEYGSTRISEDMFDLNKRDETKRALKNLLEPIGLWEENAFGIYSVIISS